MQRELRLECLKVAATLTHTPEAAIKAAQAMLSFVESGQVAGTFMAGAGPTPADAGSPSRPSEAGSLAC